MKLKPFTKKRLKGFVYAFNGAMILIKKEQSIQMQLFIALLVISAGFNFDITATEGCFNCLPSVLF